MRGGGLAVGGKRRERGWGYKREDILAEGERELIDGRSDLMPFGSFRSDPGQKYSRIPEKKKRK